MRRTLPLLGLMGLCLAAQDAPVLVQHARVFDGTKLVDADSVLFKGGRIEAVGKGLKAPAGAQVVDAAGGTLLPGLIDAHTHAFGPALQEALLFGVTTELDMFTDPNYARETKAHPAADQAELRSAGTLATAPGGHGTEYGFKIPTLTKPDEAQAWVDARLAEGSDYIKIVVEGGSAFQWKIPTLDAATVKALADAAHRRGKLAVAHIGSLAEAKLALAAGVDGLAHTFCDAAPDAEVAQLAAKHHAFVVPTLSVNATLCNEAPGKELLADAQLKPWLGAGQPGQLEAGFPSYKPTWPVRYANAEASVAAFRAAHVPLLAGTDAPNPGTSHGVSLHGELARLVHAGLSPVEALVAATSAPAACFHLEDRGRIAPGLRADLLLVKGDPTADISATRGIVAVWKAGIALDRAASLKSLQPQAVAAPAAGASLGSFDQGEAKAGFGLGWLPSTDEMMGGKSEVKLSVVEGGAAGTKGALRLKGTVRAGSSYPWSGTIWFPAAKPFDPVDFSSKKVLRFWAKGDGQTYRALVYAASTGYVPHTLSFTAGPEWKAIELPFADFKMDPKELSAIAFVAGPGAGDFDFEVDEVELR